MTPGGRRTKGSTIIRVDVAGTALFVITAVLAAVFFTNALQWVGAVTALTLFAVGVYCFLWSYFHAVQRSRTDEISVVTLYFLGGDPTPSRVKRAMLGLLAVQVVTATATTFARLDGPDGDPGSSLAVGFLVPMFGFGLNGLWAAFHGAFPERRVSGSPADLSTNSATNSGTHSATNSTKSVSRGAPIGQNDDHG